MERVNSANVTVIQLGARRNYLYARQLERAGLLHALVTDAAFPDGGSVASRMLARWSPRLAGAIARRTVGGVPREKLKSSLLPNIARAAFFWRPDEERFAIADEAAALACSFLNLGKPQIIVSYMGNGGSYLDRAKARGARIVTDFMVTPAYLELEEAERQHWPGWESATNAPSLIMKYRRRIERLVQISDIYLCPSRSVARDLSSVEGFDGSRVRVAPYGASGVLLRAPSPNRGRVLFAGAAGLRKGIPYLAEAASLLKARVPGIEVIVAGAVTDLVRQRRETSDLVFQGVLNADAMAGEYARADIFCLPTLAEGSATSVFEALANGLPVVTTESAGSVVTDGLEGFIVPERDPEAIASAIQRIVEDRDLRARMSRAALATAARFSDDACGDVFLDVIRELQARA